jgi:DNA mismatch repair protein MutL
MARSSPSAGTDGLHVTLRHNGKLVFEVPSSSALLDRIGRLFGAEVSNQLYAVEARQAPASLSGYIADPSCDRGTARMQYLFLNGRWIRDRSLAHAVQEAYRGLLMTGRYAVAFLFLELPPELVDVNVHPTKAEVRFRDSHALHHLVFTAIRDRLRRENLTARLQVPSTLRPGLTVPALPTSPLIADPPPAEPGDEPPPWSLASDPAPERSLPFAGPGTAPALAPALESAAPGMDQRAAPIAAHKVIQLYDAYLVVETEQGMLVIDQHALHERILFEQFKARLNEGSLETQPLLIPQTIELTPEQVARTLEVKNELRELGLGIEDFGGGTLLLTSYPAILGRRDPQAVLRAVVDHLMTHDRLPARAVLFNGLLSLMACHSAVRSGDKLTAEEMNALVAQRSLADDTHHCPHGRPTALLFSKQDLEKQFRRI